MFLHFFCEINAKFMEKYVKRDIESRSDPDEMIGLWKDHFRNIYELINEINENLLQKTENKDVWCKDIQKFFNFLMFTFESLLKIKKISDRKVAIHS